MHVLKAHLSLISENWCPLTCATSPFSRLPYRKIVELWLPQLFGKGLVKARERDEYYKYWCSIDTQYLWYRTQNHTSTVISVPHCAHVILHFNGQCGKKDHGIHSCIKGLQKCFSQKVSEELPQQVSAFRVLEQPFNFSNCSSPLSLSA